MHTVTYILNLLFMKCVAIGARNSEIPVTTQEIKINVKNYGNKLEVKSLGMNQRMETG